MKRIELNNITESRVGDVLEICLNEPTRGNQKWEIYLPGDMALMGGRYEAIVDNSDYIKRVWWFNVLNYGEYEVMCVLRGTCCGNKVVQVDKYKVIVR